MGPVVLAEPVAERDHPDLLVIVPALALARAAGVVGPERVRRLAGREGARGVAAPFAFASGLAVVGHRHRVLMGGARTGSSLTQ